MADVLKARVAETSTTTGTGAITLAGAVTAYRRFSAVCSVNDTTDYAIYAVDDNNIPTGEWEEGVGTYSAANTLTRTTPKSGSAATPVNFSAGTKIVIHTPTADRLGMIPTTSAASKTTPVDADEMPLIDSAASYGLKKLTWANLKATLLAYFDKSYPTIASAASRASKDANGIYTTVSYRRADNTLIRQSVLSGGTSPEYTTRTETVYDTDGTTALATLVFTLTYTAGVLTSEDLA
jgi:hypothetical protein